MKKILLFILLTYQHLFQAQIPPSPRYSFAFAYDESRSKAVMFGGSNKEGCLNDTWEWDGTKWKLKSQLGPSPRNGPAITYDSKRKTIILFGGEMGNWSSRKFLNDTWEWNGMEWKLLSSEGPPGRANHTLVYDKARDRIVLFGGVAGQETLSDIWEWDGVKWIQVVASNGPTARFLHASVYDETTKSILIFGGNALIGPPTKESILGDLWSWDGSKWKQLETNGPSPRDHVGMVYDQLTKKVIVHGGGMFDGNSATDTWEYDGKVWTKKVMIANAPVEGYKLSYDTNSKRILLFGGFVGGSPSSLLWTLDNNNWNLIK